MCVCVCVYACVATYVICYMHFANYAILLQLIELPLLNKGLFQRVGIRGRSKGFKGVTKYDVLVQKPLFLKLSVILVLYKIKQPIPSKGLHPPHLLVHIQTSKFLDLFSNLALCIILVYFSKINTTALYPRLLVSNTTSIF